MKYIEKMLETGTSRMDDAVAPAPVSPPARASALASTDAKK